MIPFEVAVFGSDGFTTRALNMMRGIYPPRKLAKNGRHVEKNPALTTVTVIMIRPSN